ncbi:bifunctional phosphoribosylaminoimidazolecarboxamide formyltransferase/IMP cyclohydrolase [Egibacter rhizosphaerae]|uniref:Bifunctional purine biosynthesis protein PurH n=1 Tax=Egibacter rhizosphaerae TaxID=1670831 RepID=A0A411YHM6_9ACTN|nr:bifunctional phosphoribosylaminoimidazolecarboxamide formyltransferase/IMP cyclohydrolase [Egibacter rhizosphaerae]QBI20606.1 bifunctional phosphoribosylaminoimidazolecarboxamide formyltransferase/IMP cyclohydrolase [Egibacter rhizosphaerae]
MTDVLPVRRALLSTYDKTGLDELAQGLTELGAGLVSTGSTARRLREAGVQVTEVAEVTGFPEILDGRVKTLHPAIHGGLLANRDEPGHGDALARHGIATIDLLVVNLYPFEQAIADPATGDREAVEMIDIGGPAMVRAAAKNHRHVAVLTDPSDYGPLLEELRRDGGLTVARRRELAARAFAHTARYDAAIAAWFAGTGESEVFPETFATYTRAGELRYGENPHQRAAYYVDAQPWGVGSAVQHHGKELSYNNLLDTDAAWLAASEFNEPCVAIIKHTNPAGLAVADTLAEAYPPALAGDPVSAFGGIVACNRTVDGATAERIAEVFTEVVVAPGYEPEALEVLTQKSALRVLEIARPEAPRRAATHRTVSGGLLVQDLDDPAEEPGAWSQATDTAPDEGTRRDLVFAWRAVKHVKSNAIVLARDGAIVGVGAGQMSRVDSVRLAVDKAGERAQGAVLASDAFFPFSDGPEAALEAGIRGIVQPGGSKRDADTVAVCDEHAVPMLLTGVRHFRH